MVGARDIDFLQPSIVDMVRVGRNNDGGYVVPVEFLDQTRMLIALGVSDDWSFEVDFTSRTRQSCSAVLCDRSAGAWTSFINAVRIWLHPGSMRKATFTRSWSWLTNGVRFLVQVRLRRWEFYRRWVVATASNTRREVELRHLLAQHAIPDATVVKIDIEGSEYEIVEELCRWNRQATPPIGLIIEFHALHTRLSEARSLIDELRGWYEVVHLHGNNYGEVRNGIPDVVEVVLTRRTTRTLPKRTTLPLVELDQPNNPAVDEIQFQW
ncbi:MAG: FkbM family methyltransferase [Actinomycetota bacterium]